MIEFLNEQFEPMDMYVRRCTVTPDTFWYEVYHMKLNEVVCKAHTWTRLWTITRTTGMKAASS